MLELLKGRPSERLILTVTPAMKEATALMASDGDQTMSQLVRHLLAAEATRRRAIVKAEMIEIEDREGKNRLLALAREQRAEGL